jgi:hypothetical protein
VGLVDPSGIQHGDRILDGGHGGRAAHRRIRRGEDWRHEDGELRLRVRDPPQGDGRAQACAREEQNRGMCARSSHDGTTSRLELTSDHSLCQPA